MSELKVLCVDERDRARAPMMSLLLYEEAKRQGVNITVENAGVSPGMKEGLPVDQLAQDTLRQHGFDNDLDHHRSQHVQSVSTTISDFDLIIVAGRSEAEELRRIHPNLPDTKVRVEDLSPPQGLPEAYKWRFDEIEELMRGIVTGLKTRQCAPS